MNNPQLKLVCLPHWEGLYVNGVLYHQSYEISPLTIAKVLGFEIEEIWADEEYYEKMGNAFELPKKLEDVKRERGS